MKFPQRVRFTRNTSAFDYENSRNESSGCARLQKTDEIELNYSFKTKFRATDSAVQTVLTALNRNFEKLRFREKIASTYSENLAIGFWKKTASFAEA